MHLVVYAGSQPVATSRLLLPNAEVAQLTGKRLGIALEQKLDLSGVSAPGLSLFGHRVTVDDRRSRRALSWHAEKY